MNEFENKYDVNPEYLETTFIRMILSQGFPEDQVIRIFAKEIHRLTKNRKKIRTIERLETSLKRVELSLKKEKVKNNSIGFKITNKKDELFALANTSAEYFYRTKTWKQFRFYAFSKKEKVCCKCNSTKDLQLDHIQPRSIYPEKAFTLENVQILCKECNFGKGIGKNYGNPALVKIKRRPKKT